MPQRGGSLKGGRGWAALGAGCDAERGGGGRKARLRALCCSLLCAGLGSGRSLCLSPAL